MSFRFAKIRAADRRYASDAAGSPGCWLAAIAAAPLLIEPAYAAQASKLTPEPDPRVLQISPDVSGVHTGSAWTDEAGRRGYYRVVIVRVGWEHTPTAVHLQWIWERESDRTAAVLFTRAVSEVNDAAAWSMSQPRFRSLGEGRTEVVIPTMNVYSLAASTLHLSVEPDGRYRVLQLPE